MAKRDTMKSLRAERDALRKRGDRLNETIHDWSATHSKAMRNGGQALADMRAERDTARAAANIAQKELAKTQQDRRELIRALGKVTR